MSNTSDARLKEVLSYKNDRGLDETLKFFDIKPSTVERYEREAQRRDLDINEEFDEPRILIFDIETAPLEVYAWDTGKEYISSDNIKKGISFLSWSAKWLCEAEIMSERVTVEQARNRVDENIVSSLWDLLDEADVLIGHNIKRFDTKIANSRFLLNNLNPPSPYQILDTYRQVRRNFNFRSNSLDFLTKKLCEDKENKGDHDMELWRRCVEGDESALKEMEEYNQKDIRVTEDLYFKTRAYYTSGPNLALYYNDDMGNRCPRCGSEDLELGDNEYYTSTGRYKTVRCQDCGGLGRERFTDVDTEIRKDLVRTLAR